MHRGVHNKIRTRALAVLSVIMLLAGFVLTAVPAYATHGDPPNLFELDNNAQDNLATTPIDWDTVDYDGVHAVFANDSFSVPGADNAFSSSKDTENIEDWCYDPADNVPDKDDLEHAYVDLIDTATETYMYVGADRFATNGDSFLGFWLLKGGVAPGDIEGDCANGQFEFTGTHADGDILVLSDFTGGGSDVTITVFQWDTSLNGGLGGLAPAIPPGADCDDVPLTTNEQSCATVNAAPATAPWPYTPKSGSAGTFPAGSFFEGGVNLTAYFGAVGCFTSFIAETRSSSEVGADLKDLVFANFDTCKLDVTKTGDTISKVGDPSSYTITITNSGEKTLFKQSIVDDVLGNLTDGTDANIVSSTCGASLTPGQSCTITLTYTVQPGDPDPLVNTVDVIYNSDAGLAGDQVSATDDHSLNLFQPGVTVDKTGDTLSKVGDAANYTIVVTNTSSADSPNLVNGTINDTLLGNLLDGTNPNLVDSTCTATLATGNSCTIHASRIVQPGDPDPLPNTVTVHYNPSGFPNDITDSDDHSVNLFQPSVSVTKTGDTLSKVGDPANYTITVTNTSSNDSPSLVNGTIVDSLLGNLLDPANPFVDDATSTCTATLAVGASCVIHATRTVLAGDPDPLPNTVVVTYNPLNFPNVITAEASHNVNLFQPSVTLNKTGDTLGKVGDPVDYEITVTNTSSNDAPALVFNSLTDTLLGNLLDPANPFVNDATSDCGAPLASGASCTVHATRTVLAGDADPLPNTATVHLHPDGFPNDISASDSHSVNLFQPSVLVDKTGDTLSKVTDPANYTITVTNTSSADSPDLTNGSIVDTLLGDLLDPANPFVDDATSNCGTGLAVGASCTIHATRTVQAGDPDPLPNTVTVHYNPEGFPNDITDSDDHSVNLFQPSVDLEKTGDEIGKINDPVHYTVTVHNTSSADSPALEFNSLIDTLAGDLLDPTNALVTSNNCGATLASGATCTITYERVVVNGDPDPLINTAIVHMNPVGFPNDITDQDDHTTNLFAPSIQVEKTGDALSKVGDPAAYTVTITNTSEADSPDLHNATVQDSLSGNLLDPANTAVTSDTCTAIFSNGFAPGESCEIKYSRIVLAGDPDPLVNTVEVHFNPVGFPNDITDSDDHTVNLFQPGVTVEKTGDLLGKVGDPVDYTITVTNTSSGDSPNLVNGSIVDSLLGNLLDPANPFVDDGTSDCTTTLATGGSCVIHATRTVLAGDPDPLPNEVVVHYNPDGFPNDITAAAQHSVNLFQPSITVAKVCDDLSKVGDPITCTVTITNSSSADTPNLVFASILDTKVGSLLANFPTQLASGGVAQFSYPYVVQASDPDPLVNTVTVHTNPLGFPNDISATAFDTVNLFQPGVTVEKTGDTLGKVGDPVEYTITVTNNSSGDSPDLVNGTIVDTLLGDLLDPANPFVDSSTCTDTLATGGSCTINATRTVLAGDPDPLPNTVTVHYNPAGFPNDITDSDDHSVNLFQPSVELVKTGDTLSKVSDPVDYTITVTNTSSADSPNLVFVSLTDTLLGNLLDGGNSFVQNSTCGASLAPGASCTVNARRTVQLGDADPLPNTATVHMNPAGFPNDITDSDDHSVNLFQPGVDVVKTGDLLGKVGDDAHYTITVTNTGSADSPNLVNGTIVDSLLGDLLNPINTFVDSSDCATTLATGASCTITASRVVLAIDPDPLPNTVTVHYNPDGFPNDITDSSSHSVNLFQPSVDVNKTGPEFSKAGDDTPYTVVVTNTSSNDSPDLINPSVVDSLVGNLLDPANTAVTSDTCTATFSNGFAHGESCTITYNYVVQVGDPDPLVNTATVHFNPDGFPNDITDSDGHSVDLVHPSFTVTKDCLQEPVPLGASAIFTVTINNTGDIPLVFNTDENDIPANVVINAGASASFEVSQIATDPAGVFNEVNVTATLPALYNLSNVLTGTASDTCDVLAGATRTPGFWQTHFDYTIHIFQDHLGGVIDLGWRILDTNGEVFGMFYADNSKTATGAKRTKLCQTKVIASFQLLAAILNTGLDNGAAVPIDPITGLDIITATRNALQTNDTKEIMRLQALLADYNGGAGDDIGIIDDDGTLQGRADPKLSKAAATTSIADGSCT